MYRQSWLNRRYCIAAAISAAVLGLAGASGTAAPANASVANTPKTILVLGDSLSAEYGLKRGSGWVALLEQKLKTENIHAAVVNASISGDTTSGGRSRLAALLAQYRPTHLIIELGANDAMRGAPLSLTQVNLMVMTQMAQQAGAKVMLIGIQVPPNYGRDYGGRLATLFADVTKANKAALVPFLLNGVADVPDSTRLFQADRIHPKEEAQSTMLANVWPELKKLLK